MPWEIPRFFLVLCTFFLSPLESYLCYNIAAKRLFHGICVFFAPRPIRDSGRTRRERPAPPGRCFSILRRAGAVFGLFARFLRAFDLRLRRPRLWQTNAVRAAPFGAVRFLLAAALAAGFLWWSNTSLEVTQFAPAFSDLPAGFDGCRIVVLSDLHSAQFGRGNQRLYDAVAAPGAGVYFSHGRSAGSVQGCAGGVRRLHGGGPQRHRPHILCHRQSRMGAWRAYRS